MKRIYLLAVGLAATLGIGLLSARTWTSADGTKKFEGDLRAYDKKAGKVTVTMQSGRPLTFDVAKLSDGDKIFLETHGKPAAVDRAAASPPAASNNRPLRLVKLQSPQLPEMCDESRRAAVFRRSRAADLDLHGLIRPDLAKALRLIQVLDDEDGLTALRQNELLVRHSLAAE